MYLLHRLLKFLLRFIILLLMLGSFLLTVQYIQSKVYDFPIPQAFSGKYWYNPYADSDGKQLKKSNFHAHSRTWAGITNGEQRGDKVIAKYKEMHYDAPAISDYHSINAFQDTAHPAFIPVYEHGYNLFKVHQLAIGATNISYYDISLLQSLSNKQYIIERLKTVTPLVALAHPKFVKGYSPEELQKLSGYDCIEALNHFRISDVHWDAALSAGKPAWIIADDDTHDISSDKETGVIWTMVYVDSLRAADIIHSLKSGGAYGVIGKQGVNDNYLKKLEVKENTYTLLLDTLASEIKLIGQGGTEKASFKNKDSITYLLQAEDTYIRAEIINPHTKMYLNPVMKYDGKTTPINIMQAKENSKKTWAMRLVVFLACIVLLFLCKKIYFLI